MKAKEKTGEYEWIEISDKEMEIFLNRILVPPHQWRSPARTWVKTRMLPRDFLMLESLFRNERPWKKSELFGKEAIERLRRIERAITEFGVGIEKKYYVREPYRTNWVYRYILSSFRLSSEGVRLFLEFPENRIQKIK